MTTTWYLLRRLWIDVRWLAETVGYWVRPYDTLADRRRWRWHPAQRCGFSNGWRWPDPGCADPLCGGDGGQCPTCGLDVREPLA
jgi:hypothetical protein